MKHFSMILAMDEKKGIGKSGTLPRRLPSDLKYFQTITTTTIDSAKHNAVIMGKNTWLSIPEQHRPLKRRLNCVLSHTLVEYDVKDVVFFTSLEKCLEALDRDDTIENIFIIGGAQLYNTMLQNTSLQKIYLTKVQGDFECDTFFEGIPDDFSVVSATDWQQENDILYSFEVYER